jgi:hypothetical protein
MTSLGLFRVVGAAAIALPLGVMLAAQSGDPVAALQSQLSSRFKMTIITPDRSDIVTAGDVLQLHKPGLIMYAVASPMAPSNTYKNGKIGQGWGGFGKDLAITMAAAGDATAADYPHRQFVEDEKCWVTAIQVQKDGVLFQLYSDPFNDIRYYANLKIPFSDKKTVPSVDALMQLLANVLTVVPQEAQDAQQTAAPGAGPPPNPMQGGQQPGIAGQYVAAGGSQLLLLPDGSFTKSVGGDQGQGQYAVDGDNLTLTFTSTGFSQNLKIRRGRLLDMSARMLWVRIGDVPGAVPPPSVAPPAAVPASFAAIAPPPAPADALPPTIALGQTKEQVTAAFGQPAKTAKIGAKEIFYYKDMKVTFLNGKVSNVE